MTTRKTSRRVPLAALDYVVDPDALLRKLNRAARSDGRFAPIARKLAASANARRREADPFAAESFATIRKEERQ